MTESELNVVFKETCQLLSEKKLKRAFALIRKLVTDTRQGEFADRVYDLEETYQFIRKYTVEGVEDPEREKITHHLVRSLFELTVRIRESWMAAHAGSFFYQKKRASGLFPLRDPDHFLKDLAALRERDHSGDLQEGQQPDLMSPEYWQKINLLFYRILLIDEMGETEKAFITTIFEEDSLVPEGKAVLITALTFSLLRYFDDAKMELHLDLYDKNRPNTSCPPALPHRFPCGTLSV